MFFVYYYRYGVNGKAHVEKYEDSYQARILMIFIIQD